MAFLEENEWMMLNEIVYNISYIYSFDEMRRQTLIWLKMLLGFDGAVFSIVKEDELKDSVCEGFKENDPRHFEKLFNHENPMKWIIMNGRANAYSQSEMLTQESFEKTDIYKKHYLIENFRYSIGMNIVFKDEVIGHLQFFRKRESGDFSKRELFIMDQLQKHLAYRLSYEAKKGDSRYFYAKGYQEKINRDFGLTAREAEILEYAVKGYSNVAIAENMQISVNTVKKHFHSMYEKMNVKNRVQLLQSLPLSTDKINFDEL